MMRRDRRTEKDEGRRGMTKGRAERSTIKCGGQERERQSEWRERRMRVIGS